MPRGNRRPRELGNCRGTGEDPACATRDKHRHCLCGLPMSLSAEQCELCVLEGTVPMRPGENPEEWDGVTYPSWRNNRLRCTSDEPYLILAKAIGSGLDNRDYALIRGRRMPAMIVRQKDKDEEKRTPILIEPEVPPKS